MFGRMWTAFTNSLKMPHNILLSCVLVIVFLSPYFLSISIFAFWAYFPLYQLKFHVSFKVYLIPHLFHEVLPDPIYQITDMIHSLPPMYPEFYVYSFDQPHKIGFIPNVFVGLFSSPTLPSYSAIVTSHPGLPRIELWIFSGKTRLRISSGYGTFSAKAETEWFLRMQKFQC